MAFSSEVPGVSSPPIQVAEEETRIPLPDSRSVTAIRTQAAGVEAAGLFLYAPGAGSNVHDPFGSFACQRLAAEGVGTVRFQFSYMEARQRRPDPPAVLEATWRAVIEACRSDGFRLVVGGRSMGGRIASQVVAQGVKVDALALFAYPLHPPSDPSRWRDGHLGSIGVPTLFCSGTRDAFGTPEELRLAAAKVPHSRLHLLEGADHSFNVAKASGRTREEVWAEAVAAFVEWLNALPSQA